MIFNKNYSENITIILLNQLKRTVDLSRNPGRSTNPHTTIWYQLIALGDAPDGWLTVVQWPQTIGTNGTNLRMCRTLSEENEQCFTLGSAPERSKCSTKDPVQSISWQAARAAMQATNSPTDASPVGERPHLQRHLRWLPWLHRCTSQAAAVAVIRNLAALVNIPGMNRRAYERMSRNLWR